MSWRPSDSSGACVSTKAGGIQYEEITCLYPILDTFTTSAEKSFQGTEIHNWMAENWYVAVLAVALYAIFISLGKSFFATRSPWNWRVTMSLWNLGLSLFSAMGVIRTAPALLHILTNYRLQEVFCYDPESQFGSGSAGLWVLMFILSKFPELIDTFFIVIHKKPLIFLHWYHHISVLLYCWHSYVYRAPHGLIFCVMNYAVHSIMYFYYFLMAAKCKPKAFNALYITLAQISQMVVGVGVTGLGCYYLWIDPTFKTESCFLTADNNVAALLMYGSYLVLFMQFFLRRYFSSSKKSKKSKNGYSSKKVN